MYARLGSRGLALAVLLGALATSAVGMPAGRSWTPVERLESAGSIYFDFPIAGVSSTGIPWLVVEGYGGEGLTEFAWSGSSWQPEFATGSHAAIPAAFATDLTPRRWLAWVDLRRRTDGYFHLLASELTPGGFTPAETVMVTTGQGFPMSAASSNSRRWVARVQQRAPNDLTFIIRTAYSDAAGVWRELPPVGVEEQVCALAPLAERSVLLAYSGPGGISWKIAEGDGWTESGVLDRHPYPLMNDGFRPRPSGGFWLTWNDRVWARVSSWKDGAWSHGDSLHSVDPRIVRMGFTRMAAGEEERGALVWSEFWAVGPVGHEEAKVAFANDTGWSDGESVPGTGDLFELASAQDRNGDLWLLWVDRYPYATYFTHTHVHAETSIPRIVGNGSNRGLEWTLSEPAPGSWWAVLRSRKGGPLEEVARLRAGPGLEMAWTIASPPHGPETYAIRRESVDTRYLWQSPATAWPRPGRSDPAALTLRVEAGLRSAVELAGVGEGPVEVELHDVQGRRLWSTRVTPDGSTMRIEIDRTLAPGVYFASARVPAGDLRTVVRFVVLE